MKYVHLMEIGYGYVVEARKEHEMPERMVCCCEILRIHEGRVPRFPPETQAPTSVNPKERLDAT